ncbi:early activation antigen CD69 isoform X2 [Melanotaenia boesemani]|uniref:early activation antigen CD69 isoform X2 n=1 Tax=Melanotaenia boesemani TaxID=1250792 RepID=UPI001C0448B3|nr:early activation antigen CD69 isoform X2 [Melanotaenia boesemani]
MYIKFCRSYVEDKKDEASENLESKLSVELEGEKGKQTEGNARLYRAGCFFLITICSILLLVIIVLSMKLNTGSTACSGRGETTTNDKQNPSTCSMEQCQDFFPTFYSKRFGCQQCANGWLTYGRSCFFLSTFRLTWAESQMNCSSRGGSLAVITSQNVQNFLTTKGNLRYWIGLTQRDAKWTWVNNNELQESYWAEAPQHGDCAYLSSERPFAKNWDRASCQAATYFICQLQY